MLWFLILIQKKTKYQLATIKTSNFLSKAINNKVLVHGLFLDTSQTHIYIYSYFFI